MWFFVASLIISLAIALLTPKPKTPDLKPAGITDFTIPTVSEARNISLLYGTDLLKGPNVLNYGGLYTIPITKESGGGLFGGGDDVTVGYQYYMGFDFSLCWGPIDSLQQIRFGDYVAWSGNLTAEGTFGVDNYYLFGGEDGQGGVQSTCKLYVGNATQVADPYLTSIVGVQPGNRYVAHVVWYGGYIGNTQYVKPVSFICSRFPNPIGLGSNKHIIGSDANPACMIYDLYISKLYGKGYDSSYLDIASFVAVGETLYTEGLGMSAVWDSPGDQVENIIDDILRHINGTRYLDLSTGKIKIRLVRDDFTVGTLPVLDETMVKDVEDFTRGAMGSIATEVRISYRSRSAGYKQRIYIQPDVGARHQLGYARPVSLVYTGITTGANAAKLGRRELLPLSKTPASCTVVVDRNAYNLVPGDPFVLKWSPLEIVQIVLRVKEVDYGTLVDGTIRLSCTEDVYSLADAVFDENPSSGWTPISGDPLDTPVAYFLDMPYWLQQSRTSYLAFVFAIFPRGDHLGYNLWRSISSTYYKQTATTQRYVNSMTLVAGFAGGATTFDVNFLAGFAPENVTEDNVLTNGRNLLLFYNPDTGDQEFIGFRSFLDNGDGTITLSNLLRGLLDTTPLEWTTSDLCFVLALGYGTNDLTSLTSAELPLTQFWKIKGKAPVGEWDIDDGTTTIYSITHLKRVDAPYPPGYFRINSLEFPSASQLADLVLTWAHRTPTLGTMQKQQDGTGTLPASTTYTIRLYNHLGVLLRTYTGLTGTSQTYTRAQMDTDNGGGSPAFVDIEAEAVDSAKTLTSFFPQKRRVWTISDQNTLFYQLINNNTASFSGETIRTIIPASALIQEGSTVRLTFTADTGAAMTIGKVYLGNAPVSGDNWDFDGNQVQITFDTGNDGKTIAGGASADSDDITFTLDPDKPLVLAIYFTANNASYGQTISGSQTYKKTGDDAATSDTTGYTLVGGNIVYAIKQIKDPTL